MSNIPPFVLPLNGVDPVPEQLFPEGFPGFNPKADNQAVVTNPEVAEQAGYLDRHIANSRIPWLYSYPAAAANNNGAAMLICPGGGYQRLAFDKEGTDFARFFNSFGFSAFVLQYRTFEQPELQGTCPDGLLREAQRAIRVIRSRAAEYGIFKNKIGIMGFSAGGHLAACAATMFEDQHEERPELAKLSPRPDFCALIYPVVTFLTGKGHSGTQRALLGGDPAPQQLRRFSPEANVSAAVPPTFLLQAADDSVPVENSLLYFNALRAAGVPAEMHIYAQGGHGYGMRKRGLPIDNWPDRLREWALNLVN
ncbi:MAG: alpha/beta hydrolase [Oligosphaeraceae bacterium]|nr:alpha/beta hydrolase [Oligosphaeraceae bacterium]